MAMLMPMAIERMFAGALDASSVFANETDRLAYLTNPIAYAGQVVSQADSGEIFVIVKNASGNFEYVGVVGGGECKYDISESYETMTAGAKPATNKIYYLINDYTDDADVTYESGFWLYSVGEDKYIELSFSSDTKFTETEGTMVELSGLKAGTIVTGWTDHKVLQAALFPATSPSITSFTPASTVNEVGTEVGVITLSATVVKKTNPITSVTFYANDVAIETITTDVANGGTFTKDYDFETNVDTDVVFKVVVSDGVLTDATKTSTFSFVRNGFYGTDTDATLLTTSDQVRALTTVKNVKKGSTFTIQVPVGANKVVIAFPSTLGELKSVIFKESMNAEIASVFNKTAIQVEGANAYTSTEYNVYQYIPATPFSQVSTFNVTV
jgi:hypothetical protein